MHTKYFTLIIAVLIGLSSCKIIAPNYSSVEKISKLQREMGIDQAIQTLGCQPFDYYYSSEEGTKTLHFHYRFRERKVSPDKTQLRIGLTGGKERFPKKSEFYVTFKNDKLYQVTSKDGFLESRNLLIYENTIKEMKRNATDFIDPGEESRSFNKDSLTHSSYYLPQSPGIGKLQDVGSSTSLQSLEKSDQGYVKRWAIKLKPFQYSSAFSGGYNYSVGLAFEGAGKGRFAIQHNLDLDFNEINPLFRYKPDFKIYLLNDAPDGLYIAPYFTIGATTAKYDSFYGDGRLTLIAYGVGGAIGYQYMFGNDRFSIEAQFAFGMSGMYSINDSGYSPTLKENEIGFGMIPHLSFGFHFD